MNDDLTPLASAYLDGDVTADERAQVEHDPGLSAEVERLRQVRAVLGSDEPAAISTREAHLAAALDAWDHLPDVERSTAVRDQTPAGVNPAAAAGASTMTRPTSLTARRSTRTRPWMLAAAAGLIVVLGGGIVLSSLGGGDDISDSASQAPPPLGALADEPPADQFSDVEERASEAGAELAAEVASTDAPAAALDEADSAESEPIGGAESPPAEQGLVQLSSSEELALFASDALNATSSPLDAPTDADFADDAETEGFAVPTCPGIDLVVGPAVYNGALIVVGIDASTNEAVAHTIDGCAEIDRQPLP